MEYRFRMSQSVLEYIYESAKGRMEYHPDIAEKYQSIIDNYPHFKSEDEARNAATEIRKRSGKCQVWAKIGKDEEYYYIQDYFIASDDIQVLMAAEYIGMAQL